VRRLLPVFAAAAVFAGGTAVASPASPHGRTIVLREASATPQPAFVDLGKPGPTAGDVVVIRDGLLHPDGTTAGTLRQSCTMIDAAANPLAATYECATSLELAGGTIVASGPLVPTRAEQSAAITGGTGPFHRAHGQVDVRAEDDVLLVRLD
jgi:hypothetical protein